MPGKGGRHTPIYCKHCGEKLVWRSVGRNLVTYDPFTGYKTVSGTSRLECPGVTIFSVIVSHDHPQQYFRDGSDDITKTLSITNDKETGLQ